ncbi:MAG: glycosyltransferase family 2 protein [Methanobrevibacter sp.]|jgi:glycosyltransferase involved in cell wall biosynthesis|nr:glycosyltransferase family 2 protein [Candidatus Methanoflexus mossambicus]
MDTKISVIVPVYNRQDYLHKTINSIINQSFGFENIELILVDDKSTDNSCEIIKSYAEKYENVVPIFRKFNSGNPGFPRNDGLKVAKSKYVMFLDSDDEYTHEMCKKMYNAIECNELDFVSCRFQPVIKANNKITYPMYNTDIYHGLFGSESDNSLMIFEKKERNLTNMTFNAYRGIFKKSFLFENNILFPHDVFCAEDSVFGLMAFVHVNRYGLLNLYGYIYNIHMDSIGHSLKCVLKSFKGIYFAYTFCKKHDDEIINFPLKLVSDLVIFFVNGNNVSYAKKKQLILQYWDMFESFNSHIDDYHFGMFYKLLMKALTFNKKFTLFLLKCYTLLHIDKIINNPKIKKILTGHVDKNRR